MKMVAQRVVRLALVCAWLAGCATPSAPPLTPEEEYEPERVQVPTPLIEYPPIEPVELPLTQPPADPPPAPAPSAVPGPNTLALAPPSIVAVPPAALREPSAEDQELIVLLADLQRYGGLNADDVKRELANITQVLGRQRTDANRVRLAVLYTLSRANPQDD